MLSGVLIEDDLEADGGDILPFLRDHAHQVDWSAELRADREYLNNTTKTTQEK